MSAWLKCRVAWRCRKCGRKRVTTGASCATVLQWVKIEAKAGLLVCADCEGRAS